MSEVNQRNMARWIVALRSGKYTQGHGQLRSDSGAMCCLGVLCEISDLGNWGEGPCPPYIVRDDEQRALLPSAVAEWAGDADTNPQLGRTTCSNANDDLRWSFTQIADALESRYLPNTTAAQVLEEK